MLQNVTGKAGRDRNLEYFFFGFSLSFKLCLFSFWNPLFFLMFALFFSSYYLLVTFFLR